MYQNIDETIVAIASPPGGAARGIVRVSGPDAVACLQSCFSPNESPWPRRAYPHWTPGRLRLSGFVSALPCDVLLWPSKRSYTRQPTGEIHAVGSPPLLQAAVRTLCEHGARPAEPGEFTLRAFLGGRLDLTQAEAVLGVIDASGRQELEQALSQLAGGLRDQMTQLRETLLDLLARLEAGLDFVEEDIEFISQAELADELSRVQESVAQLLEQGRSRTESNDRWRVVLTGSPNVGKSSLFNALAGDALGQSALVSDVPGTTRDYLTVAVNFEGLEIQLIDVAGDEAAATGPDSDAQLQARRQLAAAHAAILCLDGSRPCNEAERNQLATGDDRRVVALTKCDLPLARDGFPRLPDSVRTSSQTGEGLDALRRRVAEQIASSTGKDGGLVSLTAVRCRESLRLAHESLGRALQLTSDGDGQE
ncbi:MAG: 50S ribosome-binding GTPase, partial [Planctomycetales bacterium]